MERMSQQQVMQALQQGELTQALSLATQALKQFPSSLELRSLFVELLCLDGQLERADQQSVLLVKQHPQCTPSALNMRQLVHAAQARVDFAKGAESAKLIGSAQENFLTLVQLQLAMQQASPESLQMTEPSSISELCQLLEAQRAETQVRDIDDSLAGFFEFFGANGHYYLTTFAEIQWLKFLPVTSVFEQVWRRAEIEIAGGISGEVFVPLVYLNSQTDQQKLGRETDWRAIANNDFYQGLGLKLLLLGEEAIRLDQMPIEQEQTQHNPQQA